MNWIYFRTSILNLILYFSIPTLLYSSEVKLKNLARFEESRLNQITGFGIVIGLNNSGDTRSPFTEQALANYLNSLGIDTKLKPKDIRNSASVIITGFVPSWVKPGDKIDVYVSSIGDARSLEGGFLIQSPLKAANGEIIAVASGLLQNTNPNKDNSKRYSRRNQPNNTAIVLNGAIVEKGFKLSSPIETKSIEEESLLFKIKVILNEPNISILSAINEKLKEEYTQEELNPTILNSRELEVVVPSNKEPHQFIAELEELSINTSPPAKIVINQKSGLIVMSGNLTIDEVAISKAGLQYNIQSKGKSRYFWSETDEKKETVFHLQKITNLKSLVEQLNQIGASSEDIIAIIQGLKKAGILHGEVIIE